MVDEINQKFQKIVIQREVFQGNNNPDNLFKIINSKIMDGEASPSNFHDYVRQLKTKIGDLFSGFCSNFQSRSVSSENPKLDCLDCGNVESIWEDIEENLKALKDWVSLYCLQHT